MSRTVYVFRDGKLVPKAEAERSHSDPRVYVISDSMNATWHPANGKMFDSKSAFRRATKDAGCIEVGNEKLMPRTKHERPGMDRRSRSEAIARAIYELQNR